MRSGFDEQAHRAASQKLRKYDARCCIIFTEGYRSGHNEAVLKTVCLHGRVSSNLTPSAIQKALKMLDFQGFLLFRSQNFDAFFEVFLKLFRAYFFR